MLILFIAFGIYYGITKGVVMTTAKLFQNGRSQAVRLPKEFRFDNIEEEVIIKKLGKAVVLISKSELQDVFLGSLSKFPDDFSIERNKSSSSREISL
jgi:antitoxin VapB